jgi:hypothetical protein
MSKETTADIAIRLMAYLLKVRARIEEADELGDNAFAVALHVIAGTVQAAVLNGKILEFADHCLEFAATQARHPGHPELFLAHPDDRNPADN